MAGDVQIMESTGKNTRRERNRRTPVQPPKKEHKISLMKVGISFLIVIALVLGSVSVVTVIKNREIHLSNLYDKSNAVFGIEKVQFNANRAAAFSENLCVPDGTEDDSSLNLTSGAAGSFDLASGEVDYAQNIFNKMYPASITKVMTALVTLKNCSLDETVTVGEECQDIESGSSVCMIEPGDQLTVEQLLYGLLLNSGNDAAMSLAVYVGGTVDNFVNMMNEEAASLGATGTHFANPHGLHDENHYTTAYDIYLMFQEALKYDAFQEIIGSSEYYSIFIRDNDKYGIMWQSTNYYHIGEATPPQDVEVIGGKTGTAEKQPRSAKNYLVSFAGFAPADDPQLFVYVVVDVPGFPPGDQQAHSSFASNIFSKIMSEALPYLNVFPTGDLPEESQDANGQTPSEGINTPAPSETGSEENGESQPEESQKVYETDEYVDTDGGSGIPDAVPGDPNAPELPAADPGGDTEAGAQLPSANESSSEAGNSQEGSSENSTENSTEEETSQSQSE